MRRICFWLGASALGLFSIGCASVDYPGGPSVGQLVNDLSPDEIVRAEYVRPTESAPTVRLQRADDPPVVIIQPPPVAAPIVAPPIVAPAAAPPAAPPVAPPSPPAADPVPLTISIAPPPPSGSPAPKKSLPPPVDPSPVARPIDIAPPPKSAIQQVSMNRSSRVTVRARVNGRPIFHDEVMLELQMTAGSGLDSASPDAINKAFNDTLMHIIDLEIAYQDAVRKLEKVGGNTLQKLRDSVDREFEKQVRGMRKNLPDERFQEIAPTFRRQFERQYIAMEYLRSMVFPHTDKIGYLQVKEYYDTHLNEFQKVESVKWQHAFIAVKKDRPSVAACRAFGESLIARVSAAPPDKQEEAFKSLSEFDDGDSKTRGGMGFGSRKGEIQPAQLEKELFALKNGQIGGIQEVPGTGVHLFRLIERDPGGQVPLNDSVQAQIRNKIRNQVFERELKSLIGTLKARAVWEVEKN